MLINNKLQATRLSFTICVNRIVVGAQLGDSTLQSSNIEVTQ